MPHAVPPEHRFQGGKDLILTANAGNLARRLGLAPSLKEIEELKTVAGTYCDISTFETFCREVTHSHDSPELLAELFACYDPKGTGKIPSRTARNILQSCGEVLTREEVTAVLADLGASSNEIDYRDFCARESHLTRLVGSAVAQLGLSAHIIGSLRRLSSAQHVSDGFSDALLLDENYLLDTPEFNSF